jgi:hypothetical protein
MASTDVAKWLGGAALMAACGPARTAPPPEPPSLKDIGEVRAKAVPKPDPPPEPPLLSEYPCESLVTEADKRAEADGKKTIIRHNAGDPPSPPTGRLPPEVIQARVRANYGSIRACYEAGLRKNPDLYGKVTMRFVIETDGHVRRVTPTCTSLPDPQVVRCIAEQYTKLTFPEPERGIVTVVYPIMFSPGE